MTHPDKPLFPHDETEAERVDSPAISERVRQLVHAELLETGQTVTVDGYLGIASVGELKLDLELDEQRTL